MLIISRTLGERIMIGDDITIVVTAIGPHQVRLGIEAPQETLILREELLPDRRPREEGRDAR